MKTPSARSLLLLPPIVVSFATALLFALAAACDSDHPTPDAGLADAAVDAAAVDGAAADAADAADAATDESPTPADAAVDTERVSPPGDDIALLSVGGTRIKARRLEGEGADLSGGWHDLLLDQRCAFTPAADGKLRCLPVDSAAMTDIRYGDAGCTKRVAVLARSACAAPAYLTELVNDLCPSGSKLFRRGAEVAASVPLFAKAADGTCAGTTAPAASRIVFEVGEEIALDTLAAGNLRTGPAQDRLAPVFLETDDGARTAFLLHDVLQNLDCGLRHGILRCLPRPLVTESTTIFADAACATAAGTGLGVGCPRADFVLRVVGGSCPIRNAVFASGARLASGYSRAGAECRPSATAAFPVAAEVSPGAFAEAWQTLAPGTGRLRMRQNTSVLGSQRTGTAKDGVLGIDCFATVAADGSTRCVPVDTADFVAQFADVACTERVARRATNACAPTHATSTDTTVCPTRLHVFKIRGTWPGSVYQKAADGTCAQLPPSAAWQYYLFGDEVPVESLAELKVVLK